MFQENKFLLKFNDYLVKTNEDVKRRKEEEERKRQIRASMNDAILSRFRGEV